MLTTLIDIEDARGRLAAGERPYAFEMSDRATVAGPACGYRTEYLNGLIDAVQRSRADSEIFM